MAHIKAQMKPVAWRYFDSFKPIIWHLTKDAKVALAYQQKGWLVKPLVEIKRVAPDKEKK